MNLSTHTDTPGCKEMQTVSPENILETKPKLAGSSGNLSSYGQKVKSISPSAKFPCQSQLSTVRDDSSGTVTFSSCGKSLPQPLNNYPGQNIDANPNIVRNSQTGNSISPGLDGRRKPSPQVRNVRVNIVNPAVRYLQRTTRSVSSVISESPYLSSQGATGLENEYVGLNPCQSVNNFSVGNINLENLKIYGELPESTGSIRNVLDVVSTPESRNKRKRYMPFRSPFLDRTNQDEDESESQCVPKKRKVEYEDLPLGKCLLVFEETYIILYFYNCEEFIKTHLKSYILVKDIKFIFIPLQGGTKYTHLIFFSPLKMLSSD